MLLRLDEQFTKEAKSVSTPSFGDGIVDLVDQILLVSFCVRTFHLKPLGGTFVELDFFVRHDSRSRILLLMSSGCHAGVEGSGNSRSMH